MTTPQRPNPAAARPERSGNTPGRDQTEREVPAPLPGQHRGMPAYVPQTERRTTGEPHTPLDASVKETIELPHQRDEHVDMTDDTISPEIKQASDDLASGRQDTSRSVEMDRTYHEVRKTAPSDQPNEPGRKS